MAWRSVSSCTSSPSGTPIIPSSIDPRLERRLKNPKPLGIQKRVPSSDIACQDDPWPNPKQPKHGYKILVSTAHLRQCQVHACWTHAWVSARLLGPGAAWMKWMKWMKSNRQFVNPKKNQTSLSSFLMSAAPSLQVAEVSCDHDLPVWFGANLPKNKLNNQNCLSRLGHLWCLCLSKQPSQNFSSFIFIDSICSILFTCHHAQYSICSGQFC